jgi:hypothetical protein
MDDEWQLPVPKEDPEARKTPAAGGGGGGGGCPMTPGVNFVEGGMAGHDGAEFGRPDPAPAKD